MKSYFKNLAREDIQVSFPVDYHLLQPNGDELILLLHGFTQSAEIILNKLKGAFPANARVLAVNGPFPLPERKSEGYEIRFAWYFYDFLKEDYFIDYAPAVSMLKNLVTILKLDHLPKRIVGYSQGGYLAPFVAQALTNVKQVVGISSHYLKDEMTLPVSYRLDGLHGEKDEVVDCLPAQKTHHALCQEGVKGSFQILPEETHRLTPVFADALKKILTK